MRVGILETDETFAWQPLLAREADCRLRVDMRGLRYMSSRETLDLLAGRLKNFPAELVFLGSGNYHHLALPLIIRRAAGGPLQVLVFDRHLDCFPSAQGYVSCGSWIRELVKLPAVQRVVVIGVAGKLPPLPAGVLVITPGMWRSMLARRKNCWEALLGPAGVYVSIDKDVFSAPATDWGAGEMTVNEVFAFLRWCLEHRRVVGMDVCGELTPRGPWPAVEERKLIAHHEKINLALCRLLKHAAGISRREVRSRECRQAGDEPAYGMPA
ncbi:arginase family protein [Desulfofundulus thermocisternus]|jgi:arginase family enzyme|uniref:arginase family protein n=1 Tax=Desulfofundulus thermocisternus TaxID=42471 RepID=UPI000487D3EF|nr:arginase family protein [Desulfofundulus thermocisternus]